MFEKDREDEIQGSTGKIHIKEWNRMFFRHVTNTGDKKVLIIC